MKRLLTILLVIVAIIIIVPVALFYLTPSATISNVVANHVREATGRELRIDGPIERSLLPNLRIEASAVSLSNADWAAEPEMFAADGVVLAVDLFSAATGDLVVQELALTRPRIALEVSADGRRSWEDGMVSGPAPENAPVTLQGDGAAAAETEFQDLAVSLLGAAIEDGSLTYTDAVTGQQLVMEDIQLDAALPQLSEPFTAEGSATVNGRVATLTARLDNLAAYASGAPMDTQAEFSADGAAFSFNGVLADNGPDAPPRVDGRLAASLDGDAEKTAWLRTAFPPELAPLGAAELSGDIAIAPEGVDVDLSGAADYNGQSTALAVAATAGAGWAEGGAPADVDISVRNTLVDAGYAGLAGVAADQSALIDGELRASVRNAAALGAWATPLFPADAPDLSAIGAFEIAGPIKIAPDAVDVNVTGSAVVDGLDTDIVVQAAAGEGWRTGAAPADVDFSVTNAIVDAGYAGRVGMQGPGAPPLLDGTWRAKIPDVQALLRAGASRGVAPEALGGLAKLDAVDLEGAARINEAGASATVTGAVGYDGRLATLEAAVEGGADWMQGGVTQTALAARSEGLFEFDWTGQVELADMEPRRVAGDVSFATTDLRGLSAWTGAPPIDAPAGTLESLSVSTGVDFDPTRLVLSGLDAMVDEAGLTGDVTVATDGPRPKVTATLVAGDLDLRPFTGGSGGSSGATSGGGSSSGSSSGAASSGGGGSADPAGPGWSETPFELGVMRLVDADLDLTAEGVSTNVLRVNRTRMTILLDDGRLQTRIAEMALYGGQAQGVAVADGRNGLAIDIDVDVSGVQLRPLLIDTSQIDWLEGTGAFDLDIEGAGVSMARLTRSLGGSAAMRLTNGAIIGYNLAALVRNITSLGQSGGETPRTDFAEMGGTFSIQEGVAYNNDFLLQGPLVRMTGEGSIDIGSQTLNYLLRPKAVATLEGQGGARDLAGLTFPLRVTGYWGDPSITPDLSLDALDVESFIADPGAATQQLEALGALAESGDLADAVRDLTGGGDIGEAIESLTGGDGNVEDAIGGALESLTGGGDDESGGGGLGGALRGVFGN